MSPSPSDSQNSPEIKNDNDKDDNDNNTVSASAASTSTYHDERPLISDLLLKHAKEIEFVRNKIKDEELYQKDTAAAATYRVRRRYDNIWILRYILSHGKTGDLEAAANAAIETMIFREEKKLNNTNSTNQDHDKDYDLRYRMQNLGDPHDTALFHSMFSEATTTTATATTAYTATPLPGWKKLNDCCGEQALMMIQPDLTRGPILIFDLSTFDQHLVYDLFSPEDLLESNIYMNECIFQVVDEVTRRTGKLTKYCKIINCAGAQLSKINRQYLHADAAVSKQLENMYPQLVGTVLIVNSPSWISWIWSFMSMIMPQRMVQKINILPPIPFDFHSNLVSASASASASSAAVLDSHQNYLQPFLKYISQEHLPERLGGTNTQWPLECFGRIYQQQMLVEDNINK